MNESMRMELKKESDNVVLCHVSDSSNLVYLVGYFCVFRGYLDSFGRNGKLVRLWLFDSFYRLFLNIEASTRVGLHLKALLIFSATGHVFHSHVSFKI